METPTTRETFVTANVRPSGAGASTVVNGTVVPGDRRGRELGFPTANIALDDDVAADGVWVATIVLPDGSVYPATVSIGRRVTFYGRDGVRLLEAHLLDYTGDLYGLNLQVFLHSRIRMQRQFPQIQDLVAQIQRDTADTREWAATRVWARRPGTAAMIDPLAGLA